MQVECTERGILISTPTRGTELRFPFTWHEFWSVINDLEREFNGSRPVGAEQQSRSPARQGWG